MINVLALAQQLIPPTDMLWIRHESRELNQLGEWVSVFSDPIDMMGNFQPLQRDKYEFQGLDLAKSYWNLYTQNDVKGLKDSDTPDRVAHHGRLYDIVGVTPWYGYDGWNHALCVDIGEYVAPPAPPHINRLALSFIDNLQSGVLLLSGDKYPGALALSGDQKIE